jgi:hypothetical protein
MGVSNNEGHKHRRLIYRRIDPFLHRRKKIRKFVLVTVVALALYTVLIASIDRIISLFEPEIVTTSAVSAQLDPSNPSQLISNAFKLGHELTQMRYAETNDHQYIKWRNRTIVHLVALGIDVSVIHDAIDDCKLTLDETIVLRDQIREKIKKLHGVEAASTFVLGVELIPVTRAFELYLKDSEYRNKLSKSNVSILQLSSSLNANLDEAVFPDDLKIDLVTAYTQTYPEDATQVKLDQIKRFREEILNYFYRHKEDISSSEFMALSSVRLSNFLQNKTHLLDFIKNSSYNDDYSK